MVVIPGEPKGLGGWLILPAIGLFVMPIGLIIILVKNFLPIFWKGHWKILTTPGTTFYHHLWAPLIIFEIVGNIFFTMFSIILLSLFFRKDYRFPSMFVTFMMLNLAFVVSDRVFGNFIPAVAALNNIDSNNEVIRTIGMSIIWIPYFLVSKRVKNTFVKSGFTNSAQPPTENRM